MIWRIRLSVARWLLSGAPQGVELYFRRNRVLERSRAVKRGVLAQDWSEVLENAQ